MPVPWEALLPFGLLTVMFGAAGSLMNISQRAQNDGKAPRFKLDKWEHSLMERDLRLTGKKRGQSANPVSHTNTVVEQPN